jgi:hypothetical protein
MQVDTRIQVTVKFARRLKKDGLDSICPRCFITVGSAQNEDGLEPLEREHVCDPILLERVNRLLRPSGPKRRLVTARRPPAS